MDMQAFMQYTKPLEDNKNVQMQENVLTDIEGTDLGAVEDMITLLGEAKEEVSGKLEELDEKSDSDTNINTKNNIDLRSEMYNKYKEVMPKKLRDNPRYNYTYYDYLDEEDDENEDEKNE